MNGPQNVNALRVGSSDCSAIGEACARLLLSDSRLIEIVDSYPNGRLILSALYNRYGCKYQDNPQAGGYYVVYADGYKSFSPAKAFEDGYYKV